MVEQVTNYVFIFRNTSINNQQEYNAGLKTFKHQLCKCKDEEDHVFGMFVRPDK